MSLDIRSMLPEEIGAALSEMGEKPFRAKQIFSWLSKGVRSFDEMTNLSRDLRARLGERFWLAPPVPMRKQVSAEDGTVKFLWRLRDGEMVESVVMHYDYGNTVCISTQVGCRMGCAFCASTLGGLVRNLEPSEMLDQVLWSGLEAGVPISNIVLMGIGEPLDNFDAVIRFLLLVNHPDGQGVGMRHITLSTCGLVDRFDKMASYDLQLTLSVSLHAPDDETRSRLVPANRGVGVRALMDACHRYYERTGRRVSFEYAMIRDVNDSDRQAEQLAKLVRPMGGHVNLIPLNHVDGRGLSPSTPNRVRRFEDILKARGVNVTVRRRLGSDIDASCGQLRRKTGAAPTGSADGGNR